MTRTHKPNSVLTLEETAKILRVARNSAYAAAARGEIPTIRIGRKILVPVAQLEKMLGANPLIAA